MYKKTIISALILVLFCLPILAQGSEEFEFAKDYIKTLNHLSANIERAKEFSRLKFENQKDLEVASLKNANLNLAELRMAEMLSTKYINSDNPIIKKAAEMIVKTYQIHIKIAENQLNLQKVLYSSEAEADKQSIMEAMRKIADEGKGAWTMLGNCSVLVTYSLVSTIPDDQGRLSFLAITSDQRKKLLSQLVEIYGSVIKKGRSDKLTQFQICGAILFEALKGKHKSADERQK